MIKPLKQFAALTKAEKRWFWRCWWLFAKWHLKIRFQPYQKWKEDIFGGDNKESERSLTLSIARAIQLSEMAARNHIFKINCLRRCLVQQQLLSQYGFKLQLHFGVAKEHNKLKAHCWLTHNGALINDSEDVVSTYTELTMAEQQTRQIIGALK
ncbi:lasso peptide biosynthesis B2 protein [Alteromonas lipolytica]|uniref:Microcin J25-processing protein McjB C-terminal domain-containing protein n=1 Tax=Alteromonas lipolytica TaxID=1856405 RepID=A0A1E8FEE3_9ALTE|nr:lasso peptide biosynthesis B2 protein [Alteromonas lipolytica]OFI33853.1 hypothetical protein BFC17_19995 [Alteromonas lipolytica]GGF67835.1 hypothetical protein GCM10011338_20030 [Alteromonas lipolytica]